MPKHAHGIIIPIKFIYGTVFSLFFLFINVIRDLSNNSGSRCRVTSTIADRCSLPSWTMWKTCNRLLHGHWRHSNSVESVMRSKLFSQCSWIHSSVSRSFGNPMNLGRSLDGAGNRLLLTHPGAISLVPCRPFVHCDAVDGEKQTDQEIPKRYFRLHWGGWLRRFPAAHKAMWKMNAQGRYNKDMHYFVTKRNSQKFDRMVRREYRMPYYFIDDPYEPYHTRTEARAYYRSATEEVHDKLTYPELSAESLAKRAKMMTNQNQPKPV
ncbi:uncharacterized protein LOC129581460 [Paramacrobiotus metropolitanus]|uniref:uncharacterized protein LOC129581460 n=1 Tax=Paramacrobiotus metropolitanus TaxID=2943436 RepID=UPI00244610C8|nr:uncharacterized protein LOC129581460 [Paramacrobiotus metropolitanus]